MPCHFPWGLGRAWTSHPPNRERDGIELVRSTISGTSVQLIRRNPSSYDLQQAAQDDISNQNLAAVGAIGGSG